MNTGTPPVPLCDFKAFGASIKAAKNGYVDSRKKVSAGLFVFPRYLANIENKGQQASLQVFYDLFEAAARELNRPGAIPLPAAQRLRAEMDGRTARETALQSEYREVQQKEREYDTLTQNVRILL